MLSKKDFEPPPEKERTYLAHDWVDVQEDLAQCSRCKQYDDPYGLQEHDYDCYGEIKE